MTGEWSWSLWLERLGLEPGKTCGSELRFADMGLLLSAAVDGSGVTLGRSLLVHDALRDGRLTFPVANFEPLLSEKKHVARWRRDKVDDPDIEAFVTWLVAEAATTLEETKEMIRACAGDSVAESERSRPKVAASG